MCASTVERTVPDAKCWTNPAGKVLTPILNNVWGAERPFMWNRIDVGGRSAVIRLSDGAAQHLTGQYLYHFATTTGISSD